jgi:hypothetical protein
MGPHLGWLVDGARAQADARRLRSHYGAEAEAWCAFAMAALPVGDPRRKAILRISKALQAMPCRAAPAEGAAAAPCAEQSRPAAGRLGH